MKEPPVIAELANPGDDMSRPNAAFIVTRYASYTVLSWLALFSFNLRFAVFCSIIVFFFLFLERDKVVPRRLWVLGVILGSVISLTAMAVLVASIMITANEYNAILDAAAQ